MQCAGTPQSLQGPLLELADTLARDPVRLGYFVQREVLTATEPESHTKDISISRLKMRNQGILYDSLQQTAGDDLLHRRRLSIGDQVSQRARPPAVDRHIQ
jgi:hypothetical protein